MENNYIHKIALIDIKNRKILLALSKGKDAWFQPGGKREAGETDQQTLIRELQEELSLTILPGTITFYGTFEAQAYGKPEGVKVRITCYTAKYSGNIHPQMEIEKADYFAYDEVPKTSITGQLILDDLKKRGLIN